MCGAGTLAREMPAAFVKPEGLKLEGKRDLGSEASAAEEQAGLNCRFVKTVELFARG